MPISPKAAVARAWDLETKPATSPEQEAGTREPGRSRRIIDEPGLVVYEWSMNCRASWRRAWPLTAILLAASLGITASLLLKTPVPGSPSWTGWLNSGLENYADTAGQWNSGDNAVQVALPGGRSLWLFNDSYYGPVRADGTVSPASQLVHNMLLLTSGSGSSFRVTATITGPASQGVPGAAVPPVTGSPAGWWAWPAGGIVAGDAVEAIYTVFAPDGAGPFGYIPAANEVVRMPLASLSQPSSYVIRPSGIAEASVTADCGSAGTGCVQWGVGLLDAPCPPGTGLSACTYIYGEIWPSPGASSRTLVVAVAPRTALGDPGAWWYHTTTGWSRSPAGLAAPLGGDTSFTAGSVYQVADGEYVVLGSGPDGAVYAYYATDPWLSGARKILLFHAPASGGVPGFLAYQFHIEPAYSSGTNVVIGFSVTSFAHDQNCLNYAPYYDAAAYQPEFYSVTLPPDAAAAGSPRRLPAPRLHTFRRSPPGGKAWSSGLCASASPAG